MVHNGIEYGLMQAYAEGFELSFGLRRPAAIGDRRGRAGVEDGADLDRHAVQRPARLLLGVLADANDALRPKQLDDLARSYVGASAIEFAQYVEAMMTSANRIALLVCDDLAAAVEVLRRNERDLAGLEGAALLRHPIVARLVRFWVSPDAEALRERCGLRVPSGPQPSQPAS